MKGCVECISVPAAAAKRPRPQPGATAAAMAQLLAVLLSSAAASAVAPPQPLREQAQQQRLAGTFVSLDGTMCGPDVEWGAEIKAMAALKMDTVVTIASVATDKTGATLAYYPSALPFVSSWLPGRGDCVGSLLEAAHAHGGFTVHLGLELNYGFNSEFANASAAELFYRTAASHNAQVLAELHQRCTHQSPHSPPHPTHPRRAQPALHQHAAVPRPCSHAGGLLRTDGSRYAGTFVGVYDSNEINDVEMSVWATAAYYTIWVQHYLRPTHSAAAKLRLPSSNAPYFCHSGNIPGWGPAAVARFYKRLLTDVGPGLRRLWGKRSCSPHGFVKHSLTRSCCSQCRTASASRPASCTATGPARGSGSPRRWCPSTQRCRR